ncbi:menaquinone-dependent protoporphyrinogen IX dehydrogenase [Muricauda sp. SCSIO 64092]|uniref:menaquinone-dependent protoporphyrinogen IX dehydrogenase n=1 Tax=Allomuricauda sp. SCSIO 64092 TaxID=2908842 RepID=UPI001FF2B549|nr:menaquinone-dependent protoporphyrinogen IX dehydrogenase [Muricauda sp. SCSIO 64092]UOY08028.1 menaquinone-dependent protoporphyrinogen IX dehydrogenase [Muricauda sp. SCSIO 64092]
MTKKIAILYASVDGQTLKISNTLGSQLQKSHHSVDLFPVGAFDGDVKAYDLFVIGASIRYGVHDKRIIDFINTQKTQLDSVKTAFFSVNLVARKPEKNAPDTNPYVIKFFKTIDWNPTLVTVFAGKLDYKKYPFFDRIMIQFIMWMTKGPTNKNAEIEYTDWKKVEEFGEQLNGL